MKLKEKFNNMGSVMVLAMILTSLVSFLVIMFSTQIVNIIKINTKSYTDMQVKYNLEAGIDKVISKTCTQMEKELSNLLSGKNIIYSLDDINLQQGEIIEEGNIVPIQSFIIDNDDIQPSINKKVNYTLDNPITINLNVEMKDYFVKKDGKVVFVYTYVKLKTDGAPTTLINISTEKDGMPYKSNSEIRFMIKDIQKGQSGYNVIKWNSK